MLLEWLAREGGVVLSWWALLTLAGVAALPLCVRLLGGLPDRGYALARAAGLLLVGYAFWLLASLGFLRNTPGSIVFSWLLVLGVSLAIYWRSGQRFDWRAWWRENRPVVIVGEVLFLALLFVWALYRAYQNELRSTEKPMDLMFISSIMRSAIFPPHDAWMSGYAISYYYFGYVLVAMLSTVSGVPSTMGLNLGIAVLFALTGLTSFGVVYNLARSRAFHTDGLLRPKAPGRVGALVAGLLGTVFVILLGNFQAVIIEAPYQAQAVSEDYLRFWDTQARIQHRSAQRPILNPLEWNGDGWWWFRASRVLTDRNLDGNLLGAQPIDEFPQFSFLLADSHPHVMALPFAALAIGLALNLVLTWRRPSRQEIVFYGLCLGGLVFLNTWDGPIYMGVMVAADGLRRLMRNGSGRLTSNDWLNLGMLGLALLGLAALFYLPFLVGFRSQAAGVLPNLIHPTQFGQFFIMFGPFLLLLAVFLIVEAGRAGERMNWRLGFQTAGVLLLVLLAGMLLLTLVAWLVPELRNFVAQYLNASGGWEAVVPALLAKRATHGITSVVLLLGIVLVIGRLFPRLEVVQQSQTDEEDAGQVVTYPVATGFALLLVGVGIMLALIPEFLYLRDNFNTRMNTIFKFYYQGWLMFSIASAYAAYTFSRFAEVDSWRLPRLRVRLAFGILLGFVLLAGLLYPIAGLYKRMFAETGRLSSSTPLTMDGGPTMISSNDYAAIRCLDTLADSEDVVVAEAILGAYDPQSARVGSITGIPIVAGWLNHEGQWRGATFEEAAGTRGADIPELYSDLRWEVAQQIIERYGIDYIFYGDSERAEYGLLGEDKFRENLAPVCEVGSSVFYRVVDTEVATS